MGDVIYEKWASLVTQMVKNSPAVLETCIETLGWEDPLEEGVATHSSTLAFENPHEQRSLVGCSPWVCKESDRTERLCTAHMKIKVGLNFFFLTTSPYINFSNIPNAL